MSINIEVKKDTIFKAPEPHRAVDTMGLTYATTDRNELFAIKKIIHGFGGQSNFPNWKRKSCEIRSTDNGKTWQEETPYVETGTINTKLTYSLGTFLDLEENILIKFFFTSETVDGGTIKDTWSNKKLFNYYQLSKDGGQNWSKEQQIICNGYTSKKWMSAIEEGSVNTLATGQRVKLDDGSILVSCTVSSKGMPAKVTFIKGFWNDAKDAIEWQDTQILGVTEAVSNTGICEADLVTPDGVRVISTMRSQGDFDKNIFSSRQIAVSEDSGKTWSSPRKLTYDDGTDVFVPASYARFIKLKGKIFWIANIIDHAVCGQLPRYPLTIAEFDPENLCIIRESVTVIQDLPEGAPAGDERRVLGRRYTNFDHYIDRETDELVFIMSEMPKIDWDDFTTDCIRFRIKINS